VAGEFEAGQLKDRNGADNSDWVRGGGLKQWQESGRRGS
jgi:hypothetical protein